MKLHRPPLAGTGNAQLALPRQTLVETAVAALRQRIIRGEFRDGESLNQVMIAREYAISRIPLREAMRQLEAEGFLVFQPGKGAVVSALSLSEVREVIDLRARIEPDLLSKAIASMTERDLERAGQILDGYETAFRTGEVATWGEFNWRFHSTLCAPSGRAITMGILENLHHINERYARVQISVTHWERRATQEHRDILAACQKRDRRNGVKLLKKHILTAGEALVRLLEEQQNTKHKDV